MKTTFLAAFALFSLAAGFAAPPAAAFKCSSGSAGQGSCNCSGTADCTDMRHSKMCKTDLNCSQGKCSCTAALVADTGGKITRVPVGKIESGAVLKQK